MHEIRALLPRDKSDLARANEVVARGYPAVAPILPELIEWLQDYNWPVAKILAPFLASIGSPLLPEIRRVLGTKDYVWQYWVLTCLVKTAEMASALRDELKRLAERPAPEEAAEELHLVARELLGTGPSSGKAESEPSK
jgi:hypothetical protein